MDDIGIYKEKNKRTKRTIQQTFIELLKEKPFETITIGEIAKRSNINRGTFYFHYEDKYDLIEQIEQQLFADLGSILTELQASYLPGQSFAKEQEQLATALFYFIEKHSSVLTILFSTHGKSGFHLRFKQSFVKHVRTNLEQNESFVTNIPIPLEYFLSFITYAFIGLIEQWIQDGLNKTPEEMTELYIQLIQFIKNDNNG